MQHALTLARKCSIVNLLLLHNNLFRTTLDDIHRLHTQIADMDCTMLHRSVLMIIVHLIDFNFHTYFIVTNKAKI